MGMQYSGLGYLTGRKLIVDSSSRHAFEGDLPKNSN